MRPTFKLLVGDVTGQLATLRDESVNCVVTSPPYWGLRDYGMTGQLGLEATPELYVARMVSVFREVRRVLRSDGTCWLNIGDSYVANAGTQAPQTKQHTGSGYCGANRNGQTGLKPKDLVGIPWRLAFALQADGWWLRSEIIWAKPNPMPESVTDRPTKSHEQVFLLTKSARYFYDADAVKEPLAEATLADGRLGKPTERDFEREASRKGNGHRTGAGSFFTPKVTPYGEANPKAVGLGNGPRGSVEGRNLRTVWTIPTEPYPEAHFATFPTKLVEPCVKAGCPEGGVVLDPFLGSGTTAYVALALGRSCIGIELNEEYAALAERRVGSWGPKRARLAQMALGG